MYLVFEIGGSNARIGISSDKKTVSSSKTFPTPADFEEGMVLLKKIADELTSGEKFEALSGGIAGPLDKEKTMLVKSPHLPGWIGKPFKQELEKAFNCPVFLENDTVAAGLGETTSGAGTGEKIVAYLAIGTGVGGAKIVEGKVDENSLGFEPGHQIIIPSGNLCNCGGKGHLEAYIGGNYIEKIYLKKGEELTDPSAWDEISRNLAIGLVNITVLWSPDIIVLGGSVTQSIPLDKVSRIFLELLTIFPKAPKIVKSGLGDLAGLIGALTMLP